MMNNLFFNANALADSLKSWASPIVTEVASASVEQVKGQIVSGIVWAVFLLILSLILTNVLVKLGKKAKLNTDPDIDYSSRWALIFPILLSIILSIASITEVIKMSYSPKYKAIQNIINIKNPR
jgi:heme/copper-type cytochrome/quinol oxidase subunit 2